MRSEPLRFRHRFLFVFDALLMALSFLVVTLIIKIPLEESAPPLLIEPLAAYISPLIPAPGMLHILLLFTWPLWTGYFLPGVLGFAVWAFACHRFAFSGSLGGFAVGRDALRVENDLKSKTKVALMLFFVPLGGFWLPLVAPGVGSLLRYQPSSKLAPESEPPDSDRQAKEEK